MTRRSGRRRLAWIVISIAAVLAVEWWIGTESPDASSETDAPSAVAIEAGEARVLELYRSRASGEMVTVEGVVDRTLPDDDDGSRHQRFIVRLESGHTLLVAHNIDLAPRAALRAGDVARVRGEYEWTELGGVLHWTHHDPDGDHPGGWIEANGKRYR